MHDFADALERELVQAARQRTPRRVRVTGRIALRTPLAVPVLATALLAFGIGAAVIAVPSHRPNVGRTADAAVGAHELRAIVAEYAVFRRGQTRLDRSLTQRQTPPGAIPSLTRYLMTGAGHRVFVVLTRRSGHVTGWMVTTDTTGASFASFSPYPLPSAQPLWEELNQTVAIIPDSVTRVTWWTSHGTAQTTQAHGNVDLGPRSGVGATFYAGHRQLAQILQPEGRLALSAPHAATGRTGQAFITATNGVETIDIVAHGFPYRPKLTYGVWLYSGPGREYFLGMRAGSASVKGTHTVVGETGPLPRGYDRYRELLITRQPGGRTGSPGPIVLAGQFPGKTAPAVR